MYIYVTLYFSFSFWATLPKMLIWIFLHGETSNQRWQKSLWISKWPRVCHNQLQSYVPTENLSGSVTNNSLYSVGLVWILLIYPQLTVGSLYVVMKRKDALQFCLFCVVYMCCPRGGIEGLTTTQSTCRKSKDSGQKWFIFHAHSIWKGSKN